MTFRGEVKFCGITLRSLCMIIGYMHLISSITDVLSHVFTLAIVTNGFQCDISPNNIAVTTVPWLEPFLVVLNIGTHGFYPFPRVFRNQHSIYVEEMPVSTVPKCYPGMLHVYIVDVLNLLINLIWMRIVFRYVGALHKKNPDPMRIFFSLYVIKVVMQVLYLGHQPQLYSAFSIETYWFLKLVDIMVSLLFLVLVKKYINSLKRELASPKPVKPPSYIECLINANLESLTYKGPQQYKKKDHGVTITDEKKTLEATEGPTSINPIKV